MTLKDELETEVKKIFKTKWSTRDGQVVPEDDSIKFLNDAVKLDATVLYADLDSSTDLVDSNSALFSAEIYKSFLYCVARIIRNEGGVITAYDGDRIMAVYLGDSKNSDAARTALKINYIVKQVINPALAQQYADKNYKIKHVVGIDTSQLHVAKTGIRGSNDLVWVGRVANYAAKLCSLSPDYPSWITSEVYNKLNDKSKISKDGRNMWEARTWTAMNGISIYRSTWWWGI